MSPSLSGSCVPNNFSDGSDEPKDAPSERASLLERSIPKTAFSLPVTTDEHVIFTVGIYVTVTQ
ncbi:MAG: hypothetical protein VX278_06270 [Myxococcota bacterium]|nr:hypothetical protein [Myxococcota bacterium]